MNVVTEDVFNKQLHRLVEKADRSNKIDKNRK